MDKPEPARVKVEGLLAHDYDPQLVHNHIRKLDLCEEDLWMVLENANRVVIELRARQSDIQAEARIILHHCRPPET